MTTQNLLPLLLKLSIVFYKVSIAGCVPPKIPDFKKHQTQHRPRTMLYICRSLKQLKQLKFGKHPFVRTFKTWKMKLILPSSPCNMKIVVVHRKKWNYNSSRWKLLLC